MLSETQIDKLADYLNAKVDIPLAGEGTEKELLVAALNKVNGYLGGAVGDELMGLIKSLAAENTTEAELAAGKAKAVGIINAKVDIPIIGEETEAKLFGPLVDALVDMARKKLI